MKLHTGTVDEPYWKFAQYHAPFVPHAKYTANTNISACWAPLFQQYNVKLACEAHAHVLKVTWPIILSTATGNDHGFIRDNQNGTIYIGEGSWGAPQRQLYTYYNANQAYSWTRNQIQTAGFQLVNVTKQKIDVRTILATGAKYVGQVQMNDPVGTLPANLNVWNPSNGNVVTLNYSGSLSLSAVAAVNNERNNMHIYPVPTNDLITVTFNEISESGHISIYDSLGAELKTFDLAVGSKSKEINVSGFAPGTYYVFVVTKSNTQSGKIIHV